MTTKVEQQSPPDVRRLASLLAGEGVPLEAALGLLARVRGVGLQQLAAAGGCSRQLLYYAARGERSAPAALRQAAQRLLGVDPWAVWEAAAPEEVERAPEAGRSMHHARQAALRRRRRAGGAP